MRSRIYNSIQNNNTACQNGGQPLCKSRFASNPALSVWELLFSEQIIQNWILKVNTAFFTCLWVYAKQETVHFDFSDGIEH